MEKQILQLTVSDFLALVNQTLDYAYPVIALEGEVSSFKVNQGKYVFFDIKDTTGSVNCFMMAYQLRLPIEDGMKVVITGSPKLTQWGKFSLTVRSIRPIGEGDLQKSYDILKKKLEGEGLFEDSRKRPLPRLPKRIGVISSTSAAGYADFIKILNDRWGGLEVDVAHVQVQGEKAPDQIIRALRYFNGLSAPPEVIVLIRGGGSRDDLAAFNDELLVREIASSRVITLVGVGHEVDITLADLAADVRASTPSNAAQLIVPDREEVIRGVGRKVESLIGGVSRAISVNRQEIFLLMSRGLDSLERRHKDIYASLEARRRVLNQLNPETVLARGYAITKGGMAVGSEIQIIRSDHVVEATITNIKVRARKD